MSSVAYRILLVAIAKISAVTYWIPVHLIPRYSNENKIWTKLATSLQIDTVSWDKSMHRPWNVGYADQNDESYVDVWVVCIMIDDLSCLPHDHEWEFSSLKPAKAPSRDMPKLTRNEIQRFVEEYTRKLVKPGSWSAL